MIIENVTSKGISLDRNGQSMQREVYEREMVKLQSNWNSLKRWLQEQNNFLEGIPTFTKEIEREHKIQIITYDYVLDKMNELEGKDKE